MAKKSNQYTVMAKIYIDCGTVVSGASLAEALERSKSLKIEDFVTVKDESRWSNNEFTITGLYEDDE